MTKTILHIAAHMGGGVGKVLSNVILSDKKYRHLLVLLEKPIDTQFTKNLDASQVIIAPSIDVIQEHAGCADVVQWDWWNHPLMAKVLYECRDIPMRSVIWSHTAGCYYPYIKPRFVSMPDAFVFSSAYSVDNPHWTLGERTLMRNTHVINSSGGFASTQDVPLQEHDGFNVGYIGTLGYMKLLPEFVCWCKAIADIPGIRFVMIGRIPDPNLILKRAEEQGIADKFVFKGWVPDLPSELAKLDVVGYLLNKYHFGTTENALLEAMSMGIPPVCVDQCAEKYLIKTNMPRTGYLVKNKKEYTTTIGSLYQDAEARKRVGSNARKYVLENFNLDTTISKLNRVYSQVMNGKKHTMPVAETIGDTPYQWYTSGVPPVMAAEFTQYLTDSTKGSVAQWSKYYPEDRMLANLVMF